MIKIAFVIDTIESPTGGTEKQLLLLLEKLDRTRFAPVLCVLYSSRWLEHHFTLCPLHVLDITSYRHPASLYRFWQFVRYLKRERFDIVHTLFKEGMRIGISAARLAAVRLVISVRRSQGYWMTPLDLKVTKLLNRGVDLVISNAHHTRLWAAEVEGFPIERTAVVHNGVELEPFRGVPEDTRLRQRALLGVPAQAPVVGIVANLRPVKAIDVFLRSAQLVREAVPEAHFMIVGEGELKQGLQQLAQELALGESVHFLGRRQDIPQLLSACDLGVLSSSSESFSNTIVEYLASGLPVVCTDVGGAREAVEDGVNGFVVSAGDHAAMSQRIIDIFRSGTGKALGAASRRKAQECFSLPSMMARYEAIYLGHWGRS